MLIICYLSLSSSPPDLNIEFQYIDKVGHFGSYFLLMFWFAQLYKTPSVRLRYLLFFIFMGATLEVLQGIGGVRFFEYSDMLANTFGVAAAWLISKNHLNNLFLMLEKIIIR
ncbi:MAG: VanZ family protein [Gammaproteobacteria bacterium]|nr:VanZ family protein [Gammaproteobacteria bacterium]